jgi:hypothetical protein
MTWTYKQSTGDLNSDHDYEGRGYSGTGEGRNNPAMQNVPDVGPIPVGTWNIGPAYDDDHLGPCVMHLDPAEGTETFGRSLFRIHGDNPQHDASHGCVILGPLIRRIISSSDDKTLVVVS